jgi:hypothetical protein
MYKNSFAFCKENFKKMPKMRSVLIKLFQKFVVITKKVDLQSTKSILSPEAGFCI